MRVAGDERRRGGGRRESERFRLVMPHQGFIRRRAPTSATAIVHDIETHVAVEAKLYLVHVEAVAAPFDVM